MEITESTPIIGVDGGGTGCRVAFGTLAGGILATGTSGPSNIATDMQHALGNIVKAAEIAVETAGFSISTLSKSIAYMGLAGGNVANTDTMAGALPFAKTVISDDRASAIIGALNGQDGFLVALGTGSIVARNHAGKQSYVNGWGFHLSDHASGAWIGRAALDYTLQAVDGMVQHSSLTKSLLSRFDGDPRAIPPFALHAKPSAYAALAPDVISAAKERDPIALLIMQHGAEYLEKGLRSLGFQPGASLCLTGGVGPFYQDHLPPDMTRTLIKAQGSSLEGAFQLACTIAINSQEAE